MTQSVTYKMNRKVKGSRTFFFPTINGKRLNATNYARKYDAENLVKSYLKHYGAKKVARDGRRMTPALAAELDRLGVRALPVTKPKPEHPPAWKPQHAGEQPPF